MRFHRQQPSVTYKDYRKYREYTRRDFRMVCAYCFRHEEEAGGEEHFEQDHFEPKNRPNVDPANYFNLYWSCRGCNSRRNKGTNWPKPEELAVGEKFCDPCDHDPVGTDYTENDDGLLEPISPAGRYTIRHIRLNDRVILIELRSRRRNVRRTYSAVLQRLRRALTEWRAKPQDDLARERCNELSRWVDRYASYVEREPFMLDWFPLTVPAELI